MQKLKAIGTAVLAGLIGCGIMLILPGVSESTATVGSVERRIPLATIEQTVKHIIR